MKRSDTQMLFLLFAALAGIVAMLLWLFAYLGIKW